MSLLVFQPALDPFHAVFRFLRLRSVVKAVGSLPIDHVRILDFYLLFPFRIRAIRLASNHQQFKKLSKGYAHLTPYGEQPDAPLLFERMRPLQLAAIETLASRNYVDEDAFLNDTFRPTDEKLPDEVPSRVTGLNEIQADLMDFLLVLARDYQLPEQNGLKARTGLMEHRYDAV